MADERGELRALNAVIEACRIRAADLGMPSLTYLLDKAEQSLASHAAQAAAPQIPRGPALSVPRGRVPRN